MAPSRNEKRSVKEEEEAPSPTFLDRFIVHLAKELVGPKVVAQVLKEQTNGKDNKEFGIVKKSNLRYYNPSEGSPSPLYWRSELFLDDPWDLLDSSKWPYRKTKGPRKHLASVDLTFEFSNKPRKEVKATWGCFLLHSNNNHDDDDDDKKSDALEKDQSGSSSWRGRKEKESSSYATYWESKPMTLSGLEKHAESLHIDLDSAPPQNLAAMMKAALVDKNSRFKSNSSPGSKAKKAKGFHIRLKDPGDGSTANSDTIQLELNYQDLGDKGTLTLELDEESTPMNRSACKLLYRSLMPPVSDEIWCRSSTFGTTSNFQGSINNSSPASFKGLFGSQNMHSQNTYSQNNMYSQSRTTPSPGENDSLVEENELDQVLEEWFRRKERVPEESQAKTDAPTMLPQTKKRVGLGLSSRNNNNKNKKRRNKDRNRLPYVKVPSSIIKP